MNEVLHLTLLLDEALLLLGSVLLVVRPRPSTWLLPGAWALQVLLVVQSVVGLVLIGGSRTERPGLFAAYLLASLALLPLAGALVRRDDVRLAAVRLGVGAALAIVLQTRLVDLWSQRG